MTVKKLGLWKSCSPGEGVGGRREESRGLNYGANWMSNKTTEWKSEEGESADFWSNA